MTSTPTDPIDRSAESPALTGSTGPTIIRAAVPQDVALLLELVTELAEYEHLEDQLRGGEAQLSETMFGEHPAAEALIAERGAETAGYALFFPTFSSFLASRGVWLEDLFVRPPHRGAGVGRALLSAVAARTLQRGDARLEWVALDWNELALGFYRSLGARTMGEWVTHRLDGPDLARVAQEFSARSEQERR